MTRRKADLRYHDIASEDLVFSPDRKRAATWYVERHSEDRYDDDTYYEVVVWDASTKDEVTVFYRSYLVAHDSRQERGKPLSSVAFAQDGKSLVIRYQDDTSDTERLPP